MSGYELIGREEQKAVDDLFADGGVLFRHGFDKQRKYKFHVLDFQKEIAKWTGTKFALATTSGTSAIKVGLKSLGVKPGDEVITQAFTFVATVDAILDCGAIPVLINIDETLGMDPTELEKAITKKTKVIIPVNMLGVPVKLDKIMAIAKKNHLPVLQDNCESLGSKWEGKYIDTFTDASAISLDFGKMITCGDGGILFTNNKELFTLATEYHDHGHMSNPAFPRGKDTHRIYGFNYRMTEVQAVIASAQLKKLKYTLKKNKEHYEYLQKNLSDIQGLVFRAIPAKCTPSFDTLIFHLPAKEHADIFAQKMSKVGLGTKNIPSAMEWHFAGFWDHIFTNLSKKELWNKFLPSYELLSRSIALPISVKTTKAELKKTVSLLKKIAYETL